MRPFPPVYCNDAILLIPNPGLMILIRSVNTFINSTNLVGQWERGLRRWSAAARLLRLWVRIPPGAWMSVVSVVLSGRDLCDELITRPEESYRLCCVVVCDLETSRMGAPYVYDISCLRVKFVTTIT